jgi:hypothetical protein
MHCTCLNSAFVAVVRTAVDIVEKSCRHLYHIVALLDSSASAVAEVLQLYCNIGYDRHCVFVVVVVLITIDLFRYIGVFLCSTVNK